MFQTTFFGTYDASEASTRACVVCKFFRLIPRTAPPPDADDDARVATTCPLLPPTLRGIPHVLAQELGGGAAARFFALFFFVIFFLLQSARVSYPRLLP